MNLGLIFIHRAKLVDLKSYFDKIGKLKHWFFAFIIPFVISGLTLVSILFLNTKFKFKKPDFWVEFGLSTLTDIPIYYLWNLPLLLSAIIVITLLLDDFKFLKVLGISLLLSLSFVLVMPITSFQKLDLRIFSFIPLIFGMIFYNLTIHKTFHSFWISVFSILISIYSYVLVFGSSNSIVIKTFFARMYSNWSGLFVFKKFDVYLIDLFYSGLMILFALLFFIFDKKKNDNL